jgi:hypothetical protein
MNINQSIDDLKTIAAKFMQETKSISVLDFVVWYDCRMTNINSMEKVRKK